MSDPRQVFEGVEFNPRFADTSISYDPQLHFYTVEQEVAAQGLTMVLGFGAPFARTGGFSFAESVTPVTKFNDLGLEDRTIDKQGKGVGARMYNSPQAVLGLADLPYTIGAFVFGIDTYRILDKRAKEGSILGRIGSHGLRMVKAALQGVDTVVDEIHYSYGSVQAVHFTQPPRADFRAKLERGARPPEGLPPEFLLIRDPRVTLHRIGDYPIPGYSTK